MSIIGNLVGIDWSRVIVLSFWFPFKFNEWDHELLSPSWIDLSAAPRPDGLYSLSCLETRIIFTPIRIEIDVAKLTFE